MFILTLLSLFTALCVCFNNLLDKEGLALYKAINPSEESKYTYTYTHKHTLDEKNQSVKKILSPSLSPSLPLLAVMSGLSSSGLIRLFQM